MGKRFLEYPLLNIKVKNHSLYRYFINIRHTIYKTEATLLYGSVNKQDVDNLYVWQHFININFDENF